MIPARKLCNSSFHKGSRWLLCSYFYAKGWDDAKEIPRNLQSCCIACQRIQSRIYQGIKRRGRPFEAQQPSLRRFNKAEYRRRRRAYYEEHKEEINTRRREIFAAQKRRREAEYAKHKKYVESLPSKNPRLHVPRDEDYANNIYKVKLVEIGPFRDWLNRWRKEDGNLIFLLAEAMDINESRLRRIANATPTRASRNGKTYYYPQGQKYITLDFVDRCLIAAGGDTMLWELYDID